MPHALDDNEAKEALAFFQGVVRSSGARVWDHLGAGSRQSGLIVPFGEMHLPFEAK